MSGWHLRHRIKSRLFCWSAQHRVLRQASVCRHIIYLLPLHPPPPQQAQGGGHGFGAAMENIAATPLRCAREHRHVASPPSAQEISSATPLLAGEYQVARSPLGRSLQLRLPMPFPNVFLML